MRLRVKLLLIFSVLILVWGGASSFFFGKKIEAEQHALEKKEIASKVNILKDHILFRFENKKDVVKSYAHWDDMYNFVHNKDKNKHKEFSEKELSKETLINSKFDLIAIKDKNDNIIFSETLGKKFDENLFKKINKDECSFVKSEELYTICSISIKDSKGQSKNKHVGYVIIGFLIQNNFFEKIEKSSGLKVQIEKNFNSKEEMEEIIHKWTDKNLSNKTKIETKEGNIYAYVDIKDNFGNSIGYFKINTDRENFNQLRNGLDVIENSVLLFLLLFVFITLIIIDYLFVAEIKNIGAFFQDIQKTRKYNKRLKEKSENSNDEIEILKRNINEIVEIVELQIEELNKLAEVDALTNLYNRRYFEMRLENTINQNKRVPINLSLCILDVDFFKKYNDYYSHYLGDMVLVQVAEILRKHVKRKTDYVVRLGGEEFAIVLEHTKEEDAQRFFENIINDFNLIKLTHEKSDVAEYLTVSMGMAMLRRDDSIENLYKRADLSLYAAKNQGRNRLVYLKEEDEE